MKLNKETFKKAKWKIHSGLNNAIKETENYSILYSSNSKVYIYFFDGTIREMQLDIDDISTVEEIEEVAENMYNALSAITSEIKH